VKDGTGTTVLTGARHSGGITVKAASAGQHRGPEGNILNNASLVSTRLARHLCRQPVGHRRSHRRGSVPSLMDPHPIGRHSGRNADSVGLSDANLAPRATASVPQRPVGLGQGRGQNSVDPSDHSTAGCCGIMYQPVTWTAHRRTGGWEVRHWPLTCSGVNTTPAARSSMAAPCRSPRANLGAAGGDHVGGRIDRNDQDASAASR